LFAGIVEQTGHVDGVRPHADGCRLRISAPAAFFAGPIGASVAVNGVCLTLCDIDGDVGGFDVVPETLSRCNLGQLRAGDAVNLERSLRVGDRIDGHFVQGHVDAVGVVRRIDRTGEYRVWIEPPDAAWPCIVAKGSIALDGVSLTIAEVRPPQFAVALIPTTLQRTTLGVRRPGDRVNIETDVLARLVVARLDEMRGAREGGLTRERLVAAGFLS